MANYKSNEYHLKKKSFINVCCDEDGTLNLDIGEGEGEGNIEPADVTNRFITCQR